MINVVPLNHPKPIYPLGPSTEKLSSMKAVPGAKVVGDCSYKGPRTKHAARKVHGFTDTGSSVEGSKGKGTDDVGCR